MDPSQTSLDPQSIQRVRTGDPKEPASLSPAPLTDWAPILDALTLSQRRYLAAIQAGADPLAARQRAGGSISPSRIHNWLETSPQFVRAHDAIQAGLAILGVPAARELAAADMPDLVGHWSRKARAAERDRDQATFGRLLGEVAGAVGQGAQLQVQVNTLVQVPMNPATAPGRRVVEAQSDPP